MANANELLIRINADAKNAIKAFDDVTQQTEALQESLNKASIVGAAVFAALSAEVFLSVRAFNESEQASNQLTQALQNQGIFTTQLRQDYKDIAAELQKKTGVDDDQIIKAQAIAQSYLGQSKITKELSAAIVDLSTKTGSLDSAAQLVGRSIGTSTNALARNGIAIREGSTQAERYTQVLAQLQIQYGGQAAAADQANGGLGRLAAAFSDIQEEIGGRIAPAVRVVTARLTELLEGIKDNKPLLDFAVALGAGAAAAAGLIAIAAPVAFAFTTISAGLAAVGVAGTAATVALFGIPLAVAAVVGAFTFLAVGSEETKLKIQAAFSAIGEFIKEKLGGASAGAAYAQALKKYEDLTRDGMAKITAEVEKGGEKQNEALKRTADKAAAEKRAQEGRERASAAAATDLKLAQLNKESQELIAIKQQEAAILKNLETEKNREVIEASQTRLEELRTLEDEQHAQDLERQRLFAEDKAAVQAELREEGYAVDSGLANQQLEAIRSQKQTETQVEIEEAKKRLSAKVASDNLYLADQKKFGTAYAEINRIMHSEVYKGTAKASGELAALQASSNSTLKGIGKAAAVANIVIKTAESAMNIFAGFSTIPIVGPALGVAGAAAAVAFGAEQVGRVTAAADGALVGGSGRGDTQPYMLEPGELVAPRRDFNDVVNGTQTERSGIIDEIRDSLGRLESGGGGGVSIVVNGDVLAEDSFIDRLADALRNAVENRNLDLVAARTV